MEEYETVLLVKPEVFVYKIPPRATNRGYRAADWKLDAPDWTGRMRVVSKGKTCCIKLEDKNSGELFAKSPIDKYPGIAVEAVMDSSRYFVLRIEDDNGRAAFIGIGFADRGDSFDLNVALQEHFLWLQKSEEIEQEGNDAQNKTSLDLGFKEGQTITINMNIGKKGGNSKPRPKTSAFSGTPGLLPPPPGGIKIPPPTSKVVLGSSTITSTSDSVKEPSNPGTNTLLLDLDLAASGDSISAKPSEPPKSTEQWGDFTTASGISSSVSQNPGTSEDWINF